MGSLVDIAVRRASRAPMETVTSAAITTASGVEPDFRGRPGRRQVTVLAVESWRAACRDCGREVPWTVRRANLLVEGVELAERVGAILRIGAALLEVTGETAPCGRMEEQVAGMRCALEPHWRGGVTCRVLEGGRVRVGDEVSWSRQAS